MKKMALLLMVVLLMVWSFVGTSLAQEPSPYGQFYLSDDIIKYLSLNESQVDRQRKILFSLNYDWSAAVMKIADIQEQTESLINDPHLSPEVIGSKVGELAKQSVQIGRDLFWQVLNVRAYQHDMLNPAQKMLLQSIPGVVQQASNYVGLGYAAKYSNLSPTNYHVGVYYTVNLYNDSEDGYGKANEGSSDINQMTMLSKALSGDVTSERSKRSAREMETQRVRRLTTGR